MLDTEATSVLTGGAAQWQTERLDKVLRAFGQAQTGRCLVFLLGLVNHWVSLVVNKVAGHVEMILMNSVNDLILDATDEELWEVGRRKRRT